MGVIRFSRLLLNALLFIPLVSYSQPPVPGQFTVCYDFACKSKSQVQFSQFDWAQVAALFDETVTDAKEERQRMRHGVALMELLVGNYTPTHVDVAGNWPAQDSTKLESGHMDCIDESINATTYLKIFENAGLLRHHLVRKRAYRKSLFDQHWAAQFVDTGTGKIYVIDSWFQDNGELPVMVSGKSWHNLSWF